MNPNLVMGRATSCCEVGAATLPLGELRSLLTELASAVTDGPEAEGSGWDRVFSGRDEDSLVHSGFKPTSTRAGWARQDNHGNDWVVYAQDDGGQGGMVWYKIGEDGVSVKQGNMMFSQFKQLFDKPYRGSTIIREYK